MLRGDGRPLHHALRLYFRDLTMAIPMSPPRFPQPRNLSNTEGAKTMAREIERYWARPENGGHKIITWIVGSASQDTTRHEGCMGVRSNLLNGRPPE